MFVEMPLYCEQAIGMIKALVVASPMDVSRFECWLEMLCLTLCRFLILAIADQRCCSSTHMHHQCRCCSQQGPFPPLLQPWSSCFLAGGSSRKEMVSNHFLLQEGQKVHQPRCQCLSSSNFVTCCWCSQHACQQPKSHPWWGTKMTERGKHRPSKACLSTNMVGNQTPLQLKQGKGTAQNKIWITTMNLFMWMAQLLTANSVVD